MIRNTLLLEQIDQYIIDQIFLKSFPWNANKQLILTGFEMVA